MARKVHSVCALCVHECGMEVEVEDGEVVAVRGSRDHAVSRGFLCPRGYAAPRLLKAPHRLRKPLIKEGDGWREASWDEALSYAASKLDEVRKRYGARSIAVWGGSVAIENLHDFAGFAQRFCDAVGTPNWVEAGSWCFWSMILARLATFGKYMIPDPERAGCILLWAHNPSASDPLTALRLSRALGKGAKLIVIDCRRTTWAEKADIFIQPRPGSDIYLALAMINVIIEEGLYDREFVEEWTVGFKELASHVSKYTPEVAAEKADVPAGLIREAARLYASTKPACIVQGITALDHYVAGFQVSRAIAILQALVGCVDVEGGFTRPPGLKVNSYRLPGRVLEPPLGFDKHLLYRGLKGQRPGFAHAFTVLEAARTGVPYPVKAMIVVGGNPVATMPDHDRVVEALKNLDLLVVADLFMTQTAELAHVVLPTCSFLERPGLCTNYRVMHGEPYVAFRQQCVEPLGESKPDWWIWCELAKRLGLGDLFPWRSLEEAVAWVLEPSGLKLSDLLSRHPAGIAYAPRFKPREYEAYGGFPTPSGKVELYSRQLEVEGVPPLPTPVELDELKPSDEYPLLLITGVRQQFSTHSQLRWVEPFESRVGEPIAEVHVDVLSQLGVGDGGYVRVSTRHGSAVLRARASVKVRRDVVSVPHAWPEVNRLLSFEPMDPATGYPVLKAIPCRVEAA